MAMRSYVARRLALALFVLAGVSFVTFVVARVVPSDPAALYVGGKPNAELIARARETLRLDRPLYEQYFSYVADAVQGDFGESLRTRRSVTGDILYFLPSSLQLIVLALVLATVSGIALGAFSAQKRGGLLDHSGRLISIAGVSLPPFFLGLVLQLAFFGWLGWLPVAGATSPDVGQIYPITRVTGASLIDAAVTVNPVAFWDSLWHIVLPVITLAAFPFGVITRMSRSSMLENFGQDYVRMARAVGLPRRKIVFKYTLKNAVAPVIALLGLMFAYCIVGTFYVEMIFSYPGLGTYAVNSILALDYPAIMGITLIVAAIYVVANLVVDLFLAWVDPRVVLQ
jgi:peptide/nickel transport system permease protein